MTIWYIAGCVVLTLAGLDVSLTVLYARDDVGLVVPWFNRLVWIGVRKLARIRSPIIRYVVTFCGSALVLLNPIVWVSLFTVGFACLYYPTLSDEIVASHGAAKTTFLNAIYYSGFCFSTLGLGDLEPKTSFFEILSVVQALVGFGLLTMVLTYFQNVYSSLVQQNALGSYLHTFTGFTGDASILLKRAYETGDFADISMHFAERLISTKEFHHSYPIIRYFRFKESEYAIARMLCICLDAASIHEALTRTSRSSNHSMTVLGEAASDVAQKLYPRLSRSRKQKTAQEKLPQELRRLWRKRFRAAVVQLHDQDVVQEADTENAEAIYLELRERWGRRVLELCDLLALPWQSADPVVAQISGEVDAETGVLTNAPTA